MLENKLQLKWKIPRWKILVLPYIVVKGINIRLSIFQKKNIQTQLHRLSREEKWTQVKEADSSGFWYDVKLLNIP